MQELSKIKQRDLIFRAWDKVNKKMHNDVIPIRLQSNMPYWIFGNGSDYQGTYGDQYVVNTFIQIGEFEIMQFTGLKDRAQKDIYDCDILTDGAYSWVVSWNEDHACFQVTAIKNHVVAEVINNENMTVVGNIFENPDLL